MTLRVFVLVLFGFCMMQSQAQLEVTTVGTDFWFGFMNNFEANTATFTVFISSEEVASGVVEIPLQGWSENFITTPGVTTSINIPISSENVTSGIIENKGIHVTSDNPISLYCINYAAFTSDGSRILPKQFLDIDYIVSGYIGLGGFGGSGYVSEMLVVSTEDGTEVEITPSCNMQGGATAGVPFTVQLDQGETYLLKASNAGLDVTGTLVKGTELSGDCRPFAVFGGSQCPNIPDGCAACDHIFDQTIPTSVWGTEYFTVPLSGSTSYTYRVLASEDGTQISIDGVPAYVLNANEFQEVNDENAALLISADAPISVVQYMEGTDCAGSGDPAMLALNSTNQTMDQVTFATVVSTIIVNHNLNVVVPSTATNAVILDGAPIPPSDFTAFAGDPSYSYAQVDIGEGSHNLQCDQRFVAYVYGTGDAESYAYSTGAKALEPLEPVINVTCSDGQVTLQSDVNYSSVWWSTLDAPMDTVFVGQPFIINPPIQNQIYILHGDNFLSGCSEEEFFSVESPEELDVNIIETSIDLCLYQEYTFEPTVAPAGSDYNYDWTSSGAFIVNDEENGIISPFESGYYYLDVTTFSGCSAGIDSVFVNIIGDDVTFFDAVADPLAVCEGDTVFLDAITGVNLGLDFFSSGASPTMWDDLTGAALGDICGSMSGFALYFEGGVDRWAETVDYDMTLGGAVSFAIQISDGTGACDGAEFGEDVLLQYSTDGGGGWTTLMTLFEGLYPEFQVVQVPLPTAAQNATTRFRWIQPSFSALNEDVWMLDNISINNYGSSGNPYVWTSTEAIDDVNAQSTFSVPTLDTYFVVETSTGGCNFSDSVLVEVQSNFTLTITNDTTLCTPDDVPLSVTTSVPGTYTYQWDNAATLTNPFVPSPVADPTLPTTYTVEVTSSAGCVNSETVTIDVLSQAAPIIIADQTSICQGSVELEIDPGGNPDNYVYSWTPANLVDDPNAGTVTATPLVTTVFEVSVVDTVNMCNSVTDIEITVNQINLELPNDTVLCDSEGLVINYDFVPQWFHTFTWNNPGSLNDPFTAFPTITVPDFNGELILTLEDFLIGCTVTDTMVISTQSIDYTAPEVLTICPGASVQANVTGDFISITWTPSPNLNITDPEAPIFTNDVNETFYFNMLSQVGCSIDDSVQIVVNIPADFEIIANDTLCDGSAILLDNPLSGLTYLWNTTEVTEDIFVSEGGTYTLLITDSAGCNVSDDIIIESFPVPAFEISGIQALCIGETTSLTANIEDVTYLWSNAAIGQVEDFSLAGQTIIWAEVTDTMGCVFRDSIDVLFNPPPSLLLSTAGAICEDTGIVITAEANMVDFLWETNETTAEIEVFEEQYYVVTVTDSLDCSTTDSIFVEQIIFPIEQALDTFFCENSQVVIFPELFLGFDVSWSNGSQADSVIINSQGNYQMILTNENCEKKYPFFVQYEANPELELTREGLFCALDLFNANGYPLTAISDGMVEWQNGFATGAVYEVFEEGLYDAIAYSDVGCTSAASILVLNECVPNVYAPSAFTPDDDGVNDLWKVIVSGEIDKYEISIYDRWGSKVFESIDPEQPWNGSVNGGDYYAGDGIYHYVIVYEAWVNVPEIISEEKVGFVTIVR